MGKEAVVFVELCGQLSEAGIPSLMKLIDQGSSRVRDRLEPPWASIRNALGTTCAIVYSFHLPTDHRVGDSFNCAFSPFDPHPVEVSLKITGAVWSWGLVTDDLERNHKYYLIIEGDIAILRDLGLKEYDDSRDIIEDFLVGICKRRDWPEVERFLRKNARYLRRP